MPIQRYYTYTDETGVTFNEVSMPSYTTNDLVTNSEYHITDDVITKPSRVFINAIDIDWCGVEFEALPNEVIHSTGELINAVDTMHTLQLSELQEAHDDVKNVVESQINGLDTKINAKIDNVEQGLDYLMSEDMDVTDDIENINVKKEQLTERIKSLEKYRF